MSGGFGVEGVLFGARRIERVWPQPWATTRLQFCCLQACKLVVGYEIDGVETSPAQSEREQMHKLNPNTHVATRGDNTPYFEHDCDACRFCGVEG